MQLPEGATAVVRALSVPALLVDKVGAVLFANPAFTRIWPEPLRNLADLLDAVSDEAHVLQSMVRNAHFDHLDKVLKHPIRNRLLRSTRLKSLLVETPTFLLELHDRSDRLKHFSALNDLQRSMKMAQRESLSNRQRLEEAETLAMTDSLTECWNRRAFDLRAASMWAECYRQRTWISLLLVDIDHFKDINDAWGHQQGDRVLRLVAGCLKPCVKRHTDLFARFGGEEFAALLYGTDAAGAMVTAQSMNEAMHEMALPHPTATVSEHITVSVGTSSAIPTDEHMGFGALVRSADVALYRAKMRGRDRAQRGEAPRLPRTADPEMATRRATDPSTPR